ncbi:MAG: sensor histidine kinase [Desulfobacteraceae bacterium]|nr:MAG: sensor histidine kinase [Desulfobacteraceae bacterium]
MLHCIADVSETTKVLDQPVKKDPGNSYYRALTRNMILVVLVVSFTPLILVSGIILYEFQQSYREKVYAHLAEVVEKQRQRIDSFLTERLGNLRFISNTFTFEELSNESFLQDTLVALQQGYEPVFVDVGVVNERGVQVAYAGPFKLGNALYEEADWFKKAIESDYFISDVFLGLRGLPHFIIAVRNNYGGRPWILRATVDFVAFNNLVERIRIGQTGFAFILNRDGEFQTKPRMEFASRRGPYRDFLGISEDKGDGVHIVRKEDASGSDSIYVAGFLKQGDWLLVYQQLASDAFSELWRARSIALAIFLLGGIGIVAMAFFLSRRMVNRIASSEREKEAADEQVIETGKLAAIGELAAGIAHEINNPVAIMVEEAGWIGDLLEEEDLKNSSNREEFRRALKQIHTQGHRCKEITHKLLSFARRTDSKVKETQVNDTIREVAALSEQRAKFSNVVIETDLQEDLPLMRVSETEMQQVFLNLINNAIDAMDKKGGKIRITSRMQHAGPHGAAVLIDVVDNGTGIPKANMGRIFDPFFTTKPVGKGTGLGLSICFGIINKMGGEITVESTVGVGTAFHIRVPISPNAGEGIASDVDLRQKGASL